MGKLSIAIGGIEGSFSEEAALAYANREAFDPELIYKTTAKGTFEEAIEGSADLGIIALENSNGGVVYETIYAAGKYLFDVKEIFEIDVRQNLLVKKGTKKANIKKITSHAQALAQCKMYLKRKWPEAKIKEYEDTALAARHLAEGKLSADTAVIASRRAAKIFDLEILEPNIQDLKFNFTSFLVIEKKK